MEDKEMSKDLLMERKNGYDGNALIYYTNV